MGVGGGARPRGHRGPRREPRRQPTAFGWAPRLVEGPPAVLGAAQTGDLDVLDGELVVVRDLLVDVDVLFGVDDDLLLRLHRDHLGVAVGLWARRGCAEQRAPRTPTQSAATKGPRTELWAWRLIPLPGATCSRPPLSHTGNEGPWPLMLNRNDDDGNINQVSPRASVSFTWQVTPKLVRIA